MNKRQVDDMKSMKEYCNSVEDCGLCIMKNGSRRFYDKKDIDARIEALKGGADYGN